MTGRDRLWAEWSLLPSAAVSACVLVAVWFLVIGQVALATASACYAIVLIQSRLNLARLIRGFPGAPTLRRLVRSAVFFLPLPFLGLPQIRPHIWGVAAGVGWGLLLLLCRLPELRFGLSAEFIGILPPLTTEDRLREVMHLVVGAAGQEYLYRGVVLYLLAGYVGIWSIAVAALLFALEHLVHPNASQVFDRRDYLFQTLLGLGLGAIFCASGALVGCMLGHVIYDSPGVIQALRRRRSDASQDGARRVPTG